MATLRSYACVARNRVDNRVSLSCKFHIMDKQDIMVEMYYFDSIRALSSVDNMNIDVDDVLKNENPMNSYAKLKSGECNSNENTTHILCVFRALFSTHFRRENSWGVYLGLLFDLIYSGIIPGTFTYKYVIQDNETKCTLLYAQDLDLLHMCIIGDFKEYVKDILFSQDKNSMYNICNIEKPLYTYMKANVTCAVRYTPLNLAIISGSMNTASFIYNHVKRYSMLMENMMGPMYKPYIIMLFMCFLEYCRDSLVIDYETLDTIKNMQDGHYRLALIFLDKIDNIHDIKFFPDKTDVYSRIGDILDACVSFVRKSIVIRGNEDNTETNKTEMEIDERKTLDELNETYSDDWIDYIFDNPIPSAY